MSTQDGNDILTPNDKEQAETLSSFFVSFFTKEGNGYIPKLKRHPVKEDMKNLEIWPNTLLVRFHPDKCEVLRTGKQHDTNHKYNLCNTTTCRKK